MTYNPNTKPKAVRGTVAQRYLNYAEENHYQPYVKDSNSISGQDVKNWEDLNPRYGQPSQNSHYTGAHKRAQDALSFFSGRQQPNPLPIWQEFGFRDKASYDRQVAAENQRVNAPRAVQQVVQPVQQPVAQQSRPWEDFGLSEREYNQQKALYTALQTAPQPVRQQPVAQSVRQQPVAQSVRQQPVAQSVRQQPVAQPVRQQPVAQSVKQPVKPVSREVALQQQELNYWNQQRDSKKQGSVAKQLQDDWNLAFKLQTEECMKAGNSYSPKAQQSRSNVSYQLQNQGYWAQSFQSLNNNSSQRGNNR